MQRSSTCALLATALFLAIVSVPASALVLPPEGVRLSQIHVQFEWPATVGAAGYDLQVVVDDTTTDPFSSAPLVVDLEVTHATPREVVTSGLAFGTAYAWRARAVVAGVPQAWGTTHRFETEPVPGFLPTMTVTSGAGTPEPGLTLFNIKSRNGSIPGGLAVAVDETGALVWFLRDTTDSINDIRMLPNGRITFIRAGRANEALLNGQATWLQHEHPDFEAHHELFPMPNGNMLTLVRDFRDVLRDGEPQSWRGDRIVEFERATGTLVFDWSTHDYYSYLDFDETVMAAPTLNGATAYNWIHANAVTYDEPTQTVYLSARMLSRISAIAYPSGAIRYNMGFGAPSMPSGGATFGDNLFSWQHAQELQSNGNLLIYDNGNRRDHEDQTPATGVSKAVEVALTGTPPTSAAIVWEHTLPVYTPFIGDADRLPGGTTLIAVGSGGMIIEVDPAGAEVWRLALPNGTPDWVIPRAERIPALIVDVPSDPDGDGIADLVDRCPDIANPLQLDTDGLGDACDLDDDDDWLLDVYETGTGLFVSPEDTGSDPLNPDSNANGTPDGEEVIAGNDPNPFSPEPSVPTLPGGALALLGVAVGLLGANRARRHAIRTHAS